MKGYNRLLSQKQQARDNFFGYGRHLALDNFMKLFLKKYESERTLVP